MPQKKILFSIVIPFYKNTNLIFDSINSITKQKNDKFNFEIIIVNDGLKNDKKIKSKINRSIDIKFSYIKLKKNLGPGIARNYGIRKAVGMYILFLDSDDTLKKDCLSYLHSIIQKKKIRYYNF